MELVARNLSHVYEGLDVLRDVSLTVGEGEILCVVGPSGCGKSTLLRLLGGLERPTGGEVFSAGDPPIGSLNPITYIFQDFALLPWRSVEGNISLVLEDHGLGAKRRSAIVEDVLERTKLSDFRRAWPRQLSGGMKQRVAIARALSVKPAVLLMDEPLSALDGQTRELLMDDFAELWAREKFSACYVTHNLFEAVRLGHRVVVLSGRPGCIRDVFEIDLPLEERASRFAELNELHRRLWSLVREEARQVDRELSNGA